MALDKVSIQAWLLDGFVADFQPLSHGLYSQEFCRAWGALATGFQHPSQGRYATNLSSKVKRHHEVNTFESIVKFRFSRTKLFFKNILEQSLRATDLLNRVGKFFATTLY